MISLKSENCDVSIDAMRGGSVSAFNWRNQPIFRPNCGPSIFDTACFPLIPFSNRIAHGQFSASGQQVHLQPNFPGSDHPHPLHGFGWLASWDVVSKTNSEAVLDHRYAGGEWPWPYVAQQHFFVGEDSLTIGLSVRNMGDTPMPCGLGLHPYFPCNDTTILHALHSSEIMVDDECLPVGANQSDGPTDWWQGEPVASRNVDTTYLNRAGQITIRWPDRHLQLLIEPTDTLLHTVIYTPNGYDYFCVEPVSHPTNSFNHVNLTAKDHVMVAPNGEVSASFRFTVIPTGH